MILSLFSLEKYLIILIALIVKLVNMENNDIGKNFIPDEKQQKYLDQLCAESYGLIEIYLDSYDNFSQSNVMMPMAVMKEAIRVSGPIMEFLRSENMYAQFIDPNDMEQYCDPNYFLDSLAYNIPVHLKYFEKTKKIFPSALKGLEKKDFIDYDQLKLLGEL